MSRLGSSGRFLDDEDGAEARAAVLAALALAESAIQDIPPGRIDGQRNPDRELATIELHAEEKRWLVQYQRILGITRSNSPSKIARLFLRAVIASRDLLPRAPELDEDALGWIEDLPDDDLETRLRAWLDALPSDVVEKVAAATKASLRDR